MKSILLEAPGRLTLAETPEPLPPAPDEALVQVHRIGICGTDLHAFGGRQPFFTYPKIPGHELGVEVLAIGEGVENVQTGDRCSVEPYLHCGNCIACRRGKSNCCAAMQVLGVHLDGGLRERFTLPAQKLHRSEILSFDQLALVEPLAIGAHAVERAGLELGEHALVIGAGPIGLAVMQFALEKGARVSALDIDENRLTFCREKLGIHHTMNGARENAEEELRRLGEMPTAVFDATGNPRSMAGSFQLPANGGRLIFVGLFQGDVTFNDPDFHRRELTLLASRNALPSDFPRIIKLIETGRIDTDPWITHRAAFEETPNVFSSWTSPKSNVVKAIVEV